MMKLKNVLNGYLSRDVYDSIVIADLKNLDIPFCGKIEDLKNPPNLMKGYQRLLMETEVVKSIDNGTRLFFFI